MKQLIAEVARRNEAARRAQPQPGEKLRRPRKTHLGKPHGKAEKIRFRCLGCGYIVNKRERFDWVHKEQAFTVIFGGRLKGGQGIIRYTPIEDKRYMPTMVRVLKKLGKQLGYNVVKTPRAVG